MDSKHCKLSRENDYLKGKRELKEKVNGFNLDDTDEHLWIKFEGFWNRNYISAVQQSSNATNLRNKHNIKIKDIQSLFQKLYSTDSQFISENLKSGLVFNEAKINENFNEIIKTVKSLKGMKNSALELFYSYYINDNFFPNLNSTDINCIERIEYILGSDFFIDCNNDLKKITHIKNLIAKEIKVLDVELPLYYLTDQFFNLIEKIEKKDIEDKQNEIFKELYENALKFKNYNNLDISYVDEMKKLMSYSNNIILYGAPGTGKTYAATNSIKFLCDNNKDRYKIIQFHPSYTYEDFIGGIKPIKNEQISFDFIAGSFLEYCNKINTFNLEDDKNIKTPFFLLIDEINRADLSRVFGEVLFCIDKRGEEIDHQYSEISPDKFKKICIPENLYIIGTMNDVDKSIDSFDLALRRRFLWEYFDVNMDWLESEISGITGKDNYLKSIDYLNKFITNNIKLPDYYQIGPSYFSNIKNHINNNKISRNSVENIFDYYIGQLLKEYLRTYFDEQKIEGQINLARIEFLKPWNPLKN